MIYWFQGCSLCTNTRYTSESTVFLFLPSYTNKSSSNIVSLCVFQVQVAIKCLSKQKLQSTTSADFLKEAAIMQAVDHEHVVRLYGVTLGQDELRLVSP